MRARETLVAPDGYEVALFPLPYMNISQGEGGSTSHQGTYNIDFLGWDANGRVYNAPIYAPCTMRVVDTWLNYSGGNAVFFQSVNMVHLANGDIDYLTIVFGHDANPPFTTVGQLVRQGELCYHTGTYGDVTGDHVHSCCGKGIYQGTTQRPSGHTDLTNRIHYWEAVYVNDTVIIDGLSYPWKEFKKRTNFPWVLYARKLRDKRK